MTAPIKTWTPTADAALAVATYSTKALMGAIKLYRIYQMYVTAGWTLVASSDAATAGIDATVRITDQTKLIWANSGTAHSGFCFKSPAGMLPSGNSVYKTYECKGVSAEDKVLITHGSAIPSALSLTTGFTQPTNSRTINSAAALGFMNSTAADSRWRQTTSSIGDAVMIHSRNGVGYADYVGGCITATLNTETTSDFDCILFDCWVDSGIGGFTTSNMANTTYMTVFWKDGTVITTGGCVAPFNANNSNNLMALFANNVSAVTGASMDFPFFLVTQDSSKMAWKGQVTDFALAGTQASTTQGKSDPNSGGTINYVQVGGFWVPMPGLVADPVF